MFIKRYKTIMVLLLNGEQQYDKFLAHKEGIAHFAFSVFLFNSQGKLLMQKRAKSKYHSGGLWSNTCCSHPLSNDLVRIKKMAEERLFQEIGISCSLEYVFEFEYKAQCGELFENEYDYAFVGYSDDKPQINPEEVSEYKWEYLENIDKHRVMNPQEYTPWFHIIMNRYYLKIKTFLSRKIINRNNKSIFMKNRSLDNLSGNLTDRIVINRELIDNNFLKKLNKKEYKK